MDIILQETLHACSPRENVEKSSGKFVRSVTPTRSKKLTTYFVALKDESQMCSLR